MSTLWTPNKKYQLVDWLERYYPMPHKSFRKMKKNQLYAICKETQTRYLGGNF